MSGDIREGTNPEPREADRPRRQPGMRFEPLEDGCALYEPGTDRVFVLNLTASCVWASCDGERSLRELVAEIGGSMGESGPAPGRLERDIRRTIESLAGAGLLVRDGPGDDFPMPPEPVEIQQARQLSAVACPSAGRSTDLKELEILRLAARVRPGSAGRHLLAEALRDPFDGMRLAEMAEEQGIHPLVSHALDRIGYTGNRAWRRDLHAASRRALARTLVLEAEVEQLAALLAGGRVDSIAAGGAWLARRVYGSPELRASDDSELWIRRRDAEKACRLLSAAGYRIGRSEDPDDARQPGGCERGVALVRDGGLFPRTVHLHWDFAAPAQYARVDMDGVWRRARVPAGAGSAAGAFKPEDLLLLLTLRGAGRGWSRLSHFVDIDGCLGHYRQRLDWLVLAGRARQWRISDLFERALGLTAALLDTDLPEAAGACVQGGHWRADPLSDPGRWWAERGRAGAAAGPAWLRCLRERRGLFHMAGQMTTLLRPGPAHPLSGNVPARRRWMNWAARPLRSGAKFVAGAMREPPGSASATPGGRF